MSTRPSPSDGPKHRFNMNKTWLTLLFVILCCFGQQTRVSAGHLCDGIEGPECYIQIGGVHRSDCQVYYKSITESMISAINALNDGKGFGVRAGNKLDSYFFKLNYTGATYEKGERDTVGREKALQLFPQLDFIVGMGAKCKGGDADLLKFAEEAEELKKIYFTNRGPSKVLTTGELKKYFFSIHLNSDQYTQTAITQYALRGMQTASVIWEDSGNWFLEGVGRNAVKLLGEHGFDVQVNEQIPIVDGGPDFGIVNRSIDWAVGNRSDVLIFAVGRSYWGYALDRLQDAASEHAFPAVWANHIPWTNNCAGQAGKCSFAVGASQISEEEIQVYRDALLGVTYREFEASEHFVAPPEFVGTPFWDIAAMTSTFVQSIQNFYRFRALERESFLSDAEQYEELRAYIREGSLIGDTFAGPTRFTPTGANGGRSPSTMQIGEDGISRLVFPADLADAGFQYPSPASIACPLNFFRNYSAAACPLCAHECQLCPDGSGWVAPETCGCNPGFYNLENPVHDRAPSACNPCPDRAVCVGGAAPPHPVARSWGDAATPEEFHECRLKRCSGGAEYACSEGFGGHMCEDPQEGWFSLGRNFRVECPSSRVWAALMHAALVLLILLFFSVNMVLSMHYESVGIFLENMQRLAIISHFRFRWPERFASLFTVLEIILLEADLAPPECLMQWDFAWSFWVQNLIIFLFLAVAWIPVLLSVRRVAKDSACTWCEAATQRRYAAEKVNRTFGKSLDIMLMVYPAMVKNSFDAFLCRDLAGGRYLVVDPNFECGTPAHTATVVMAGLLQLVVFGLPLGIVHALSRGTQARTLHEPENIERFGVLYADFKPPFLWWEGWRTLQKLLVVAVQVFLWRYPLLQGNLTLMLFLAGLASHFYAQPYAHRVLDIMDSGAYFSSILFTMAGLAFYSPDLHWQDGLFALCMGCLGLYTAAVAFMVFLDVHERVASKDAAEHVKNEARRHMQLGADSQLDSLSLASPRSPRDDGDHEQDDAFKSRASSAITSQSMSLGSLTSDNTLLGRERKRSSAFSFQRSRSVIRLPTMFKGATFQNLARDGLTELPRTLNGFLFKRWTTAGLCTAENYRVLKTMDSWLKPWVSDQSPTSQFSLLPEADFYRSMNQVVPHFYDWIRVAHEDDVQALKRLFASILDASGQPSPNYRAAIVPGDQSSVLYWLLNDASREQREVFYEYLDMMKHAAAPDDNRSSTSDFSKAYSSFVKMRRLSLPKADKDLESGGSLAPRPRTLTRVNGIRPETPAMRAMRQARLRFDVAEQRAAPQSILTATDAVHSSLVLQSALHDSPEALSARILFNNVPQRKPLLKGASGISAKSHQSLNSDVSRRSTTAHSSYNPSAFSSLEPAVSGQPEQAAGQDDHKPAEEFNSLLPADGWADLVKRQGGSLEEQQEREELIAAGSELSAAPKQHASLPPKPPAALLLGRDRSAESDEEDEEEVFDGIARC